MQHEAPPSSPYSDIDLYAAYQRIRTAWFAIVYDPQTTIGRQEWVVEMRTAIEALGSDLWADYDAGWTGDTNAARQ